jgi:uncharacterized protein (DUF58 family)
VTGSDRVPRPRRAAVPVAASAAVLAVWGAVARGSGVGWVQTVGALVAGILVVGLAGPALAVMRVKLRAVAAPSNGVTGSPLSVQVAVRGTAVLHPLWPPGPEVPTGGAARVGLEVHPPYRGALDGCIVTVSSAAPFGLLWWTRTLSVPLPQPVLVAPRPGAPDPATVARPSDIGAGTPSAGPGAETRGVRPYVPGDRRSLVHWPATAHTGALMVRDQERPTGRTAVVRGVLPPDPDAADAQAERVLGTVGVLLASGVAVQLATVEDHGEVIEPVHTLTAAGRRLAVALPRRSEGPRPGEMLSP